MIWHRDSGVGVVALATGGSHADRPIDPLAGVGFVAVVGVGALAVSSLLAGTLLCGSPSELAASYRNRFFRQMAFAEAPALLGVVVSFVVASPLPYLAGVLVALVGFVRLAPTDARLQRDQDALALQGCGQSLTSALAAPLPPSGHRMPPH